ncbi:hypothetical protein LSAT2_031155 [Lamellibrachia satsuma]|nr:hypothetical protein LSAT2_031155 [Lamellibrachia satsuma]
MWTFEVQTHLLVLGYSFMHRLKFEVEQEGNVLGDCFAVVNIQGFGGMWLPTIRKHLEYVWSLWTQPSVVYLDKASNNLSMCGA